jgi:hypothetical protein
MATPSIETARGWRGRVMVDRDSNKIGEVVDIYLDNETDRLRQRDAGQRRTG